LAKAYPDIATNGTVGARLWNILIDSKPRMCGMKMSTSIRSKPPAATGAQRDLESARPRWSRPSLRKRIV
jgi:hypothetical protein